MVVSRRSISLSPELDQVLRRLAARRHEDVSRLIETLLRENPLVAQAVRQARGGGAPALKKGRDLEELLLLGRVARRRWTEDIAEGRVKLRAG